MKNKKGFTLIELLAVIVILAIIALIATPMIMDVIDKAKKGAVESSALGYKEGIEQYAVYGMLDNNGQVSLSGMYVVNAKDEVKEGDVVTVPSIENLGITFKGETPSDGWVAVNSKGLVVAACLKFNTYSSWVGYTDAARAKATLSAKVDLPANADAAVTTMNTALGVTTTGGADDNA